jgi:hypothetical protein
MQGIPRPAETATAGQINTSIQMHTQRYNAHMGKIMHISSRQVTESTSLCTQYISPWIFRTAAVRPLPQGGEHQHQSTEVSYSAPAISSSNSSSRFATMNRISSTIGVTPRPSVWPRRIGTCRWNLPPRGSYTIKLSRTLHRP